MAREVVERSSSCHVPHLAREVIGDRDQPGLGLGGPGHLYQVQDQEYNGGGDQDLGNHAQVKNRNWKHIGSRSQEAGVLGLLSILHVMRMKG